MEIVLPVNVARCPNCGKLAEPGSCPECGKTVPAPESASDEELSLTKSLSRFRDQFEALEKRLESLPQGTVPVTNEQFGRLVIDLGFPSKTADLIETTFGFDGLDLGDPKVVGRKLQRPMMRLLKASEPLVVAAEEICWFQSPHGRALKQIAIDAANNAVLIGVNIFECLTGPTIVEKRAGQKAMQQALDSIDLDDFTKLIAEALDAEPSLDDRIGRAIGKKGAFTAPEGYPDVAAVFGAFTGDQPLASVAHASRRYFQDVIPENADESESVAWDAVLMTSAVRLASLDSPILGHRLARGVFDLAGRAYAKDPGQVVTIAQGLESKSQRLMEATENIQDAFRSLSLEDHDGSLTLKRELMVAADVYTQIVEANYRSCGWVILQLLLVLADKFNPEEPQPRLSNLTERLMAFTEERVATDFAAQVDSDLRNAKSHAQLLWDEDTEELFSDETETRWTQEDLEDRISQISGAAIGANAGFECFLAANDIELELTPAPNKVRFATEVAKQLFRPVGLKISKVDKSGLVIAEILSRPEATGNLIGPSLSIYAMLPEANDIRVESTDGEILLDLSGDTIERIRDAKGINSLLAVPIAILDHVERTKGNAETGLRETLALQVQVLSNLTVEELQGVDFDSPGMRFALKRLSERIDFTISSTAKSRGMGSKRNRRTIDRLRRLQRSSHSLLINGTQKDWNCPAPPYFGPILMS